MSKETKIQVLKEFLKEDYSSMEKYVLSKLVKAEATIQDLASENQILNERLSKEKHKVTLEELMRLRLWFIEDMQNLNESYYKEHNEPRPTPDMVEEFINWLEERGYEIYVR